jgi:hypothetical protein
MEEEESDGGKYEELNLKLNWLLNMHNQRTSDHTETRQINNIK